ncbi:hypothetical protein TRL7639_04404 [Falsiruegeria litorea R37]|uniref:Uncharacterized protein n=1 Tax=Falsiruegeria litorea R37 TaxID=1200284 RepID=A0A1Y5U0A8_9RHOB|nr:hypothetical protein TRL7639_04404 [Falsiruegeria litorea R37]
MTTNICFHALVMPSDLRLEGHRAAGRLVVELPRMGEY